MPEDRRDKHPRKTPPAGVQAQIAPPVPREDWSPQHTPIHPTPVEMQTIDESPIQTLVRRTGETKNSTLDALAEVRELRIETKSDILEVHRKIDGVVSTVGDLREKVGESVGQNTEIIKTLDVMRAEAKNSQHIRTVGRVAEIEIDTSRQISDVKVKEAHALEPLEAAKAKREWITKALAIGSSLAAIALALLEASRC